MSTSQPSSTPNDPPPFPSPNPTDSYTQTISTLSLSTLVITPLLLLIPPRKLDLYTYSLTTAFVVAANHQTRTRTGRGILEYVADRRAERNRLAAGGTAEQDGEKVGTQDGGEARPNPGGVKGMIQNMWYGNEGQRWREKRMREEREAAEEGRGTGSVIWGQVKEVWGVRDKDEDEDENENEREESDEGKKGG